MARNTFDYLKERYFSLASQFYKEKCNDHELNLTDLHFYEMLLMEEVEVDSNENKDYALFKDLISKSRSYPIYPLFKTLIFNLLQWILYFKHPQSNTQLQNVNHLDVEFNGSICSMIDRIRKSKMLLEFFSHLDSPNERNMEMVGLNVNQSSSLKYDSSNHLDNNSLLPDLSCLGIAVCTALSAGHGTDYPLNKDNLRDAGDLHKKVAPGRYSSSSSFEALDCDIKELLTLIQKTETLLLLGMNRTVGSVEILPPQLWTLWQSYCKIHHPKSKLSVGARALSKHCHRSCDGWWGNSTGTEDDKNKHALNVLEKIFADISWMNIHMLPHDVLVLEVRCHEGYGLRWSHDGTLFRGFLEPQMVDGHEKKWKH